MPIMRIRKRGRTLNISSSDQSDTIEDRKRSRRSGTSRIRLDAAFIQSFISAVGKLHQELLEAHKSKPIYGVVQVALEALVTEYQDKGRLSQVAFEEAIELLSDQTKAMVFVSLRGLIRDNWLQRHLDIQFIDDS